MGDFRGSHDPSQLWDRWLWCILWGHFFLHLTQESAWGLFRQSLLKSSIQHFARLYTIWIGNPRSSFPSFRMSSLTFWAQHFTQLTMYSFDSREKEKYHLFKICYCSGCRCHSATANQGSIAAYPWGNLCTRSPQYFWSDMEPSDLTRADVDLCLLHEVAMVFDKPWKPYWSPPPHLESTFSR